MSDDGDRVLMVDRMVVFGFDVITEESQSQADHNIKEEGQEGWHQQKTVKDSKTDDDKDHLEEDDESLRRCKKHAKHPKYSGDCGLEDWSRDVIDRPLHSILGLIAGFVL